MPPTPSENLSGNINDMKKHLFTLSFILTGVLVLSGCSRSAQSHEAYLSETKVPQAQPNGYILNEMQEIPTELMTAPARVAPDKQLGEFHQEPLINELLAESGEYEAYIEIQSLNQDIFLTIGSDQSATEKRFEKLPKGTIIHYQLILHDRKNGHKTMIDRYNSRGVTPEITPFGLIGFKNNDQYFEYFVPIAHSAQFKMYDVIHEKQTEIRPIGFIDQRFWHNNYYIMCSHFAFDGMEAGVAIAKPPHFGVEDQYFIYPESINEIEQDRIEYLRTQFEDKEERNPQNCRIEEGQLLFEAEGEERTFDLSTLDEIEFPQDKKAVQDTETVTAE